MSQSVAETNQAVASQLSNNLSRLLREFSRDFERRMKITIQEVGFIRCPRAPPTAYNVTRRHAVANPPQPLCTPSPEHPPRHPARPLNANGA